MRKMGSMGLYDTVQQALDDIEKCEEDHKNKWEKDIDRNDRQ